MDKTPYLAQQIQIQEGLEAVRKRPGMYIGSIDSDGLHHLVYEIVDNSIDEALEGACDTIIITIQADNGISVSDNGRGIPVDIHSNDQSALEVVMTKLHAGGKFNKDVYAVSGGLHGVGCAVVNALSTHCKVVVHRDKQQFTQTFEKGKTVSDLVVEEAQDTTHTGTYVTFYPDASIFTETQEFSFEKLAHRFRELAFLMKGISITIRDEREIDSAGEIKERTFQSKRGIQDFLHVISKEKKILLTEYPYFNDKKNGVQLEFSFNYVLGQENTVLAFVNSINTREGGTHIEGFRTSFTRTINKFLKKNERLAKQLKDTLQGADVQAGLLAVISLKVPEPTFSGQTKTRLSNPEIRGIVDSILSTNLESFLDHHPNEAQKILEKCVQSARARIEGQKAYENTLRKTPLGNSSLPGKLSDCSEKDPAKTEIFLVEGDSAGGSAKMGRNRHIQAILPLFGKPTNVEKMQESIAKIQASPKLQPIIAALGTNIGSAFNIQKLRYHKIIIMADADVDGSHIRTLYLTFFFRYMKPLIEAGYIYIAMPPLYLINWGKNKEQYAFDDKEHDVIFDRLEKEGIAKDKISVRRYKGLGEMNADELGSTTMDPSQRRIMKVMLENPVEADETFTLLLGEEVAPRRAFIEENALKVANLDI